MFEYPQRPSWCLECFMETKKYFKNIDIHSQINVKEDTYWHNQSNQEIISNEHRFISNSIIDFDVEICDNKLSI